MWFLCLILLMWLVYCLDLLLNVEPPLHAWNKSQLIMVYDPCNVLLNSVHQYFVENFYISVHWWYWCVIFFPFAIFVWFCIRYGWPCKISWKHPLLFWFLEEFENFDINSSLKFGFGLLFAQSFVFFFCNKGTVLYLKRKWNYRCMKSKSLKYQRHFVWCT